MRPRVNSQKSLPHISRTKEPQPGCLRYRLLQQLHALCPLVPSNIDANPSDVAAWPCKARDNAILDWLGEDPDDRNGAGGSLNIEHKGNGNSDNQIWIPTNYLASKVRIIRCTPFAGISLDQEIAPFDIA